MHIFKRKSPSNRTSHHPMRSDEQLARPAFTPHPNVDSDRRFSQFEYDTVPGPVPNQTQGLNRSQSQRQNTSRDRPTVNIVAPDEAQSRRGRKGLFSSNIDRNISIKGKTISHPISQPASPRVSQPETLHESDESQTNLLDSYSENPSPVTVSQSLAFEEQYQSQRGPRPSHPAHAQDNEWSQQRSVRPPLYTHQPLSIQRSNTDPNLLEHYTRPSPSDIVPESPRYPTEHAHRGQHLPPQDPVLTTRPLSQQSHAPLSPLQSHYPDSMQTSTQASQTQGQFHPLERQKSAGSPQQDRSRQGMAKYSKVKRYYFEKDAQVQHLQNTVAHQRMAVSRTVLDDNEYANRFQRLDGAIKDLAFSVRKHWRSIPSWLNGMVTDDALSVGAKEMLAVGRAIVSRWLVEEVFQRYFHPALNPTFSVHLKAVEMNLRRQRPSSDEDRENASARISYWRRTTFDGLSDSLVGREADENRIELVEHLIMELAAFLGSQLDDSVLSGLEASVRMIIENSINIIEKIPLEARDVCVDYFPPGVSLVEQYMKIEGQLPALSHPPPPPSEPDQLEEPAGMEGDTSSGSTTGVIEKALPVQQRHQKRSLFGGLVGRKHASSENSRQPPAPGPVEDKSESADTPSNPRIRFAAFLAVEVRGKGPATVLIKSPVWLVE
ncbi:hypothetical protein N7457_007540 [Penicillium paradoxum]|uniref:uncharacterized protein n=1 Tax=Penicillium paradoxum TaxID=176176 RepID=UPI002547F36A|nr:uncharacterized protein N7457_007540 [Penicillium paradoxum]KAJ5779820.1 hypothetical protein N7457_007540 [Penicillium paradoxum]